MEEKFKVVLIGCGRVAEKHIKAIVHNRNLATLCAVSDLNLDAVDKIIKDSNLKKKEKLSIKKYTDYTRMLDEVKPDIALVTTPSGTHFEIASRVLDSKINLLLEKPMALSLEHADILIKKAVENNLKISLGHIYRFFPVVDILSRDISANKFGQVLYGNVKVFWGRDQSYYDSANWRGTWKDDGGVLMNQSIHAIDLMIYLMGGNIKEVCSMLARQTHNIQAEDLALGIMRFDTGAYCTIEATTNTDPEDLQASFSVLCTKGIIKGGFKSGKPFIDICTRKNKKLNAKYIIEFISRSKKSHGLSFIKKASNPHTGILKDLCLSIREDRPPIADAFSGRASLEAVLGMYKSAKTNSFVSFPLEGFSSQDMEGFF